MSGGAATAFCPQYQNGLKIRAFLPRQSRLWLSGLAWSSPETWRRTSEPSSERLTRNTLATEGELYQSVSLTGPDTAVRRAAASSLGVA